MIIPVNNPSGDRNQSPPFSLLHHLAIAKLRNGSLFWTAWPTPFPGQGVGNDQARQHRTNPVHHLQTRAFVHTEHTQYGRSVQWRFAAIVGPQQQPGSIGVLMQKRSRSSMSHPCLPHLLPSAEVFFTHKTPQLIQFNPIDLYFFDQHLVDLFRMTSRSCQPQTDRVQFDPKNIGNPPKGQPLQNKLEGKNNSVLGRSNIIEGCPLSPTEDSTACPADVFTNPTAPRMVSSVGDNAVCPWFVIVHTLFVNTSNIGDTRLWSSESHRHILHISWSIPYQRLG